MSKVNRTLKKLKDQALIALAKNMLPKSLVDEIYHIEENSNVEYVEFLKKLTLDYLRVSGYYKSPFNENKANQEIRAILVDCDIKKERSD